MSGQPLFVVRNFLKRCSKDSSRANDKYARKGAVERGALPGGGEKPRTARMPL